MILDSPSRCLRALVAVLLTVALAGVFWMTRPAALHAAPAPGVTQEPAESHESGTGETEAEGGWGSAIAKAANFAVLAGLLAYFLKSPIAEHLRGRGETIRRDLTDAAALRATAEQQLAAVRAKLAELPAELERLRRRGEEELTDERARLAGATAREKQQVVERTGREIDLRFRTARRELLEHAADLSMSIARTRIERDITPDDQARLIERYATEVRS